MWMWVKIEDPDILHVELVMFSIDLGALEEPHFGAMTTLQ